MEFFVKYKRFYSKGQSNDVKKSNSRNFKRSPWKLKEKRITTAQHRERVIPGVPIPQSWSSQDRHALISPPYQSASIHHLTQEALKSSCFDNLLKKGKDNTSSLISFCQQLVEVINFERVIQLNHKSIYSQSILLALCIGKETKSKVQLVTCEESLRGNCHFIAQDNEVDRVGFSREIAEKEGINIHDVRSWEEQFWP